MVDMILVAFVGLRPLQGRIACSLPDDFDSSMGRLHRAPGGKEDVVNSRRIDRSVHERGLSIGGRTMFHKSFAGCLCCVW